jgi:small conductance mechanosensitive channel
MSLQAADSVAAAATDAAFDIQAALGEAWTKVITWVEAVVQNLPNLIAALVVFAAFWGFARLARRLTLRLAKRVVDQPQINRLIAQAAFLLVMGLGLVLALGTMNLSKTVTSLLAGAGILGLALGFAFQDIAENFIAGIILSLRNQFNEGDIIKTSDYTGIVHRVQLRATVLQVPTGQRVLIPNAEVYKRPIVNYTQSGKHRVDIPVGVSYADDLQKAKRVAIEAVEGIESRDRHREVELYYEEFGASSINFTVRFWIDYLEQVDFFAAQSDAIMRIKKAFDEHDITIPFPIRTLDFAGGASGGQSLSTALRDAGGLGPG